MNSLKEPANFYDPDNKKPNKRLKQLTYDEAMTFGPDDPVRVYADGVFDVFHVGHSRALMQAKKVFPNVYLIVGVCGDEITREMKGQTVMNAEERYLSVLHCRYVDEVVRDAPWVITDEFLEEHRIDFVTHDDIPYANKDSDDIYGHLKRKGVFVPTQRTPNISTSDLITRIVRNYDNYVRRNLLRGYTRSELNIGYFCEQRIRIADQLSTLRRRIHQIEAFSDNLLKKWENMSQKLVTDFIKLFVGGPTFDEDEEDEFIPALSSNDLRRRHSSYSD